MSTATTEEQTMMMSITVGTTPSGYSITTFTNNLPTLDEIKAKVNELRRRYLAIVKSKREAETARVSAFKQALAVRAVDAAIAVLEMTTIKAEPAMAHVRPRRSLLSRIVSTVLYGRIR